MEKDGLDTFANDLHRQCSVIQNLSSYYDGSGSIGRRYARADEVGVPWAVTVDHETLTNSTVTIRRRDDGVQIRIELESLLAHLRMATISELF